MLIPQKFTLDWHQSLFDEDMARTWSLMTEDFRRVIAQVVLGANQLPVAELDAIVEELAVAAPARSDLPQFYKAACTVLQNACVYAPGSLGAGSTTHIEAPAFEIVRLYVLADLSVDDEGIHFLEPDGSARALTLIVAAAEDASWRMAGIGGLREPGWPPTMVWEPPTEV